MKPYWLATAPAFTGGQSADAALPSRADVVVVGGGFTGLSAALSLARAGVDVVLLEACGVVSEASGRNGGHTSAGTSQNLAALIDSLGVQRACNYYRSFSDAVAYVQAVVQAERIDCDLVTSGKLKLASKAKHFPGLAANYNALRQHVDQDVELLDAAAVRREIGSTAFFGGLLQHKGVQMHIGKFGTGLAEAAARRGARIFEQTPVTALVRRDGDRHEVRTARGTIVADRVLLATGCTMHGELDWWQRRIVPVGSFVIVTEPLGRELMDMVLPGRRNYVTTRTIGNYFRPTQDQRLVWGGRARFARNDPRSDGKSGRILQAGMRATFPALANTRIDYCWGGLVDMTTDRLPRAGKHDGVYYSLGYSGHGTQMAVQMGGVMASLVMGQHADNPWDRGGWAALPKHKGEAWFLPFAGLYYRWCDLIY